MITRRKFLGNAGAIALGTAMLQSCKLPAGNVKNPGCSYILLETK